METLLLKTKLNMPVMRESVIQRQRLVDQLNADLWTEEGFARKLTLISAPAGYGKTTAAVEWLEDYPGQVLWLSLDEKDNDPARFIAYLAAAFQEVEAKIGAQTVQMLRSPQPPQVETLITALINDLAGIQSPLILALDDYHLIQTPKIHEMVQFFLEHQPSHLHQVVLTREDPLLPVSRLLSRGQAVEIRQEDLRFTTGESAEFLNQTMGVKLPRADIEALQRRTEGWVAGLQFAALSLQGHPDLQNFVQLFTGSNRYILDYLFEEVFNRQPATVQDFLVKTSILNQLTAELCDAVVERKDSQEVLLALERSNLFIVPLDLSREWYRYHRLFRDLLRHRLEIRDRSAESALHMRASEWYEANNMQAEAVQHALLAKEWSRASELVLGLSNIMMKDGEIVTLLGWFKQFPEQVMHGDPELCLEFIWVLILTGQNDPAEAWLSHVESFTRDMPQHHGSLVSAQAYLARTRGDIPATIELSEKALTLIPQDDQATRGILAINLGITYWHVGQMEQAEKTLQEAQTLAQATGNNYALLSAMVFLGRVQAVRGNLDHAARIFKQAIEKGRKAPIVGLAHLDLGALCYEWNDLNACRDHLQRGQVINKMSGNIEFQAAGYMLQARLESAIGNQSAYTTTLMKIRELVHSGEIPNPTCNRSMALLVEMALKQGDLLEAEQLVEQLEADVDAHPFYRYIGLAKERLLIAQNKKSEAAQRLQVKTKSADQAQWAYGGIATRILESIAAENQAAGFEILMGALSRSRAEGYLRVYADHGQILVANLLEAARRGLYPEYIERILASIRQGVEIETAAAKQVEKLSERELEVLRLISVGLSNREIAEQLYLSPGTIKTHVHNICGKLGVSNRTQAVMHARDLKII
jgi:LuxR family maltose regulon positive regulatory protein